MATVCTSSFGQTIEPKPFAEASAKLEKEVRQGRVAGAMHLVVRDGKEVHFQVIGERDVEDALPMQRDTIVRMYSMTKPITSVAAMTLFDKGKFKLDDPLSKYIPAFADSKAYEKVGEKYELVAPRRPLTVRDLFRHTTGYAYDGGISEVLKKRYREEGIIYQPPAGMMPPSMSIEELSEALARIPAMHHPGERFTYGLNTDVLGRLIEIWSGKPLDQYMQQAIFEPLGMVDTGFSVPEPKRGRFASCHTMKDGKLVVIDKATTSPFNGGFEFLSGGGGLVSTIDDYAHFCQMLVDGGEFEGNQILEPETLDMMFADQLDGVAGGFKFGLGFAIKDVRIGDGENVKEAKQYSWAGYATTDFCVVPDERMFQIVIRQRVPTQPQLAQELFKAIYTGIE